MLHMIRFTILLGMVLSLQSVAFAQKSLDTPFPVISGVMLDKASLKPGADFHATTPEDVLFTEGTLPEGTQFIGYVSDLHRCGISDRLCTFDIQINQVILPNGARSYIYPYQETRPHFRFKPKFWGGTPTAYLVAGSPISLQFSPATLRGILNQVEAVETARD